MISGAKTKALTLTLQTHTLFEGHSYITRCYTTEIKQEGRWCLTTSLIQPRWCYTEMDALFVRLFVLKTQKLLPVIEQFPLSVWQNLVPKEVSRVWSPNKNQIFILYPLNWRTNAYVLTFHICQLGSSPAHTDYHSKALSVYFNQVASVAT